MISSMEHLALWVDRANEMKPGTLDDGLDANDLLFIELLKESTPLEVAAHIVLAIQVGISETPDTAIGVIAGMASLLVAADRTEGVRGDLHQAVADTQ